MSRLWTNRGSNAFVGTLVLSCLMVGSCQREERFADLGRKVASPVAIAVTDDGSYFYVLNADFERKYNAGSILIFDEAGAKKGVVDVPRMGRSMTLAGNDLIVTTDAPRPGEKGRVLLYDVTSPTAPKLKMDWRVDCGPMNAVARKDYAYFFVGCVGGGLLAGEFKADRSESTLKMVRRFGTTRRAMFLDPTRQLLLAFPTDMDVQTKADQEGVDMYSYADSGTRVAGGNEVPDAWEKTARLRRYNGYWQTYQFVAYDVATESAAGFPFRALGSDAVQRELRWIYYTLSNFDGTPDSEAGYGEPDRKAYHTNFWTAEPDPFDANSFYMSHRGPPHLSPHANNVVKVSIIGDVISAGEDAVPATADILQFERVYGFKGEVDRKSYPGDIKIVPINGQPLLIVNHFRDLLWRSRADVRFGLATKVIGDNFWYAEKTVSDPKKSYYQLAVNSRGKGFTLSVYGNAVIPLDVQPAAAITVGKPID